MSENTAYLITGANRGLGLALTAALLSRPNTTVLATTRGDPSAAYPTAAALAAAHPSSLLHVLPLDAASPATSFPEALARLQQQQQQHDDGSPRVGRLAAIVANAGTASADSFLDCAATPLAAMLDNFAVNTAANVMLYQTFGHLLTAAAATAMATAAPSEQQQQQQQQQPPKFVLISSVLGSIGTQKVGDPPALAYGMSKAAANYFVKRLHFEGAEKGLVAFALHPGWVQTAMGQKFADSIGFSKPTMTIETSVKAILEQIDAATRETSSGKFLNFDGTEIPW